MSSTQSAWWKGYNAAQAGKPPTANPYQKGTREHSEWDEGYAAGMGWSED